MGKVEIDKVEIVRWAKEKWANGQRRKGQIKANFFPKTKSKGKRGCFISKETPFLITIFAIKS